MSELAPHSILQSRVFKSWIKDVLSDPAVFDMLQLPSRDGATSALQLDLLGKDLRPVSRGLLSQLFTHVTGVVGPFKVDALTQRILKRLHELSSDSRERFLDGISGIFSVLDSTLGVSVKNLEGSSALTLYISRPLSNTELKKAFRLIQLTPQDSEERCLRKIDRAQNITTICIHHSTGDGYLDGAIFMNSLLNSNLAGSVTDLRITGGPDKPILITTPQSIFSDGRNIRKLSLANFKFSDSSGHDLTVRRIRELELHLSSAVELDTDALPRCIGLEKLTISCDVMDPVRVADIILKVCRYSPSAEITLSSQCAESSQQIGEFDIWKIQSAVCRDRNSALQRLTYNIADRQS